MTQIALLAVMIMNVRGALMVEAEAGGLPMCRVHARAAWGRTLASASMYLEPANSGIAQSSVLLISPSNTLCSRVDSVTRVISLPARSHDENPAAVRSTGSFAVANADLGASWIA